MLITTLRRLDEMNKLADTCARVLETQSGSAEVFIQLAERALQTVTIIRNSIAWRIG